MHVFIAGANGQIGRFLLQGIADSRHEARALVRHADQGPELQQLGATETVIGDLEQDCSEAMRGCDAVIFTAGSGPHTGPDKTVDVDQDGAIRLVDTAKAMGIKRFIMVSSMRAEEPEKGPEKLQHYLRAKRNADEHLKNSGCALADLPMTMATVRCLSASDWTRSERFLARTLPGFCWLCWILTIPAIVFLM